MANDELAAVEGASEWERREAERAERYAAEVAERERAREKRLSALVAVELARDTSADYHPAKFAAPVRADYLLALETEGTPARAARAVGVTQSLVATYGGRVPEFAAAEREALAIYRDSLAAEVTRRARDGIVQLRFNRNGEPIGEAVTYSDGLLSKALDRADRIIGDLPDPNAAGPRIDAAMVARLSPEGRAALRLVLAELAGLMPEEGGAQLEGSESAIDVQGGPA